MDNLVTLQTKGNKEIGSFKAVKRIQTLQTRLYPWVSISVLPDGSADLFDIVTATRMHLNPMAAAIVHEINSSKKSLGQIAVEITSKHECNLQQALTDVIKVYKLLESKELVTLSTERFLILYIQNIKLSFWNLWNLIIKMSNGTF